MSRIATIISSVVLIAYFTITIYFDGWTFSNYHLRKLHTVLPIYLVTYWLVTLASNKLNKGAIISLFITSTAIVSLIAYINLNDIVTPHLPRDISVLESDADGQKLIIQEQFNPKHNRYERDTVLINERLCFRKYIR